MQLPGHLYNTYSRYKERQKDVEDWCFATAQELSNRNQQAANHGQAGNAASHISAELSNLSFNNGKERSRQDLIQAARLIVASDDIESIPTNIADNLSEAIDLRIHCWTWFQGATHQSDTETRATNEEHRKTIIHLQAILEILLPKLPQEYHEQSIHRVKDNQDGNNNTLGNTFTSLELHEPLEVLVADVEDAMEPTTIEAGSDSPAKLNRENAELDLALYCFYINLNAMSEEIYKEMCRSATISVYNSVLPVLTNYAIDRAHATELEMEARFPGWKSHTNRLYSTVQCKGGFSKDPILRMQALLGHQMSFLIAKKHNDGMSFKLTEKEEADHGERIAYACRIYAKNPYVVQPINNNGPPAYFSADTDTQALAEERFVACLLKTASGRGMEKAQQLGNAIEQTTFLANDSTEQDGCGFLLLDYGAELIPIHAAFAYRLRFLSQVVLGAHEVEHDGSSNLARTDLQRTAWNVKIAAEQHIKELQKPQHSFQDAINGPVRMIRAFENVIEQCVRAVDISNDKVVRYLLAPLQCASISLNFQVSYTEVALLSADLGNVMAMAGQLWKLFELEGIVMPEWLDMKFIVDHMGFEFIYHGSSPGSKVLLLACFYHAQGVDEKKGKKQMRAGKVVKFEGKKVRYRPGANPLHLLGVSRVRETNQALCDSAATDLELVIYATKMQELDKKEKARIQLDREGSLFRLSNLQDLYKIRNKSPTLSSTEFTELLAQGLRREMAVLHFNWLKLEQGMETLIDNLEKELVAADSLCQVPSAATTLTSKMRWLT